MHEGEIKNVKGENEGLLGRNKRHKKSEGGKSRVTGENKRRK